MVMLGLLCIAAMVLFRGIMKRSETTLVAGVVLYAGTVIYIAFHAPELVTAAIALAVIAALFGLARVIAFRARQDGKVTRLTTFFLDH